MVCKMLQNMVRDKKPNIFMMHITRGKITDRKKDTIRLFGAMSRYSNISQSGL